MSEFIREIVGAAAACLTTASFVPQAVHVIRSKDTRALSLPMYLMFAAGVALWLVYGLMLGSWPVVIANVVTLLLVAIILALKIRHG